MSHVRISNTKLEKLVPIDFYRNEDYKKFGINDGTSTLVPMYKSLLQEAIGEKISETFQDYALSKSETKEIQVIFEKK